jgi:mRNA-degrading endonuclease RelE of RelBE toxin-antitoxin system
MAYLPKVYPKFDRIKKKLPQPLRVEIGRQVDLFCENPLLGEPKSGDLQGVRVHKFRYLREEYLLAYTVDHKAELIILLAIGGHENFYRALKRHLGS